MFAMLNQFWAMLGMFFSAGNKGASALNNLATWADESTAAFSDEAREKRKQAASKLIAETRAVEASTK